jgi:hypothetical protein
MAKKQSWLKRLRKNHPVMFWGCVVIEALAFGIIIYAMINNAVEWSSYPDSTIKWNYWSDFKMLTFILQPIAITAILSFLNICLVWVRPRTDKRFKLKVRVLECVGMIVGFLFTALFLLGFIAMTDYTDPIPLGDYHSPIWLRTIPTLLLLWGIALLGYFILAFTNAAKTPPLLTALSIAALYISAFECVMFCIQTFGNEFAVYLWLYPINLLIIYGRVIREKAYELKMRNTVPPQSGIWGWINRSLSGRWFPLWALLLAFPLLGMAIIVSLLFGQRPDDFIKAVTETADWTLSKKIAPPPSGGHYLCTVAAQGHAQLVRPKRTGIRHGSIIVVNRQLCVANAFEQILEERTPRLHRMVRHFYDHCGFSLSQHIKTRAAADIVYIVMKPLEWFFLLVLYLTTVNPEERIRGQYRC